VNFRDLTGLFIELKSENQGPQALSLTRLKFRIEMNSAHLVVRLRSGITIVTRGALISGAHSAAMVQWCDRKPRKS
jgi:hypothetical protein